ncbi:MAG: hypothetical protein HQK51_03400 [Oligoflexia bacterium]|nr:hypothetical protein [Oligoflexia bacterium]
MKKLLTIIATLTLVSSAYAIHPCGLMCRGKASPYFQSCTEQFDKCLSSVVTSDESSKSECQKKYDVCNKEVRSLQLECVDRCLESGQAYIQF